MKVEIITKKLELDIYGFSGIVLGKDYTGTAFKLMDKMWQVVKSKSLKNKGLNIWVYEPNEKLFAGMELDDTPEEGTGLEYKSIILEKYAYYNHIGPYNLIKDRGHEMENKLKNEGFEIGYPYVEIYGHWTNDESKLETELLMNIK